MPATSRIASVLTRRAAKRPGRFALEVDDNEIAARVQNLPEVIVAVMADPHR